MIFSTDFQLNLLSNSAHLYLDGTFKCTPHNFYQLLTIHSFNQLNNLITPAIFVLMTSKEHKSYIRVLEAIKKLLAERNYIYKWDKVQCDFEKAIKNAFLETFDMDINFLGCYFHYIKALYAKLKSTGLFKKRLKDFNNKLMFILKYLPFIDSPLVLEFSPLFIELISENEIKVNMEASEIIGYKRFFKYFHKNWLNYKQIWDTNKITKENFTRTNNLCEVFHRHLNSKISISNPRLSYLVGVLNRITSSIFQHTIERSLLLDDQLAISLVII